MFAARVAGSSRHGPLVLEEVGAARATGLHRRKQKRVLCGGGGRKATITKTSEASGVSVRCNEEEGTINAKLLPFILQVARVLATAEEENAPEDPRVASQPPHSRCVWFVVGGLNGRFPLRD